MWGGLIAFAVVADGIVLLVALTPIMVITGGVA